MKICTVDLSINSTGICVATSQENFVFFRISNDKKFVPFCKEIKFTRTSVIDKKDFLKPHLLKDFIYISSIIKNVSEDCDLVALEAPAFQAKGNSILDLIALHTVVKLKLVEAGKIIKYYAPSEIKKFFTGKGNSNKDAMLEEFYSRTKYAKCDAKADDIADAYALMLLTYSNETSFLVQA